MKKTTCALHIFFSNPGISPDEAWATSRSNASIDCTDIDPSKIAPCWSQRGSQKETAERISVCDGDCASCCCVFMTMRFLAENCDAASDILTAFKARFMK